MLVGVNKGVLQCFLNFLKIIFNFNLTNPVKDSASFSFFVVSSVAVLDLSHHFRRCHQVELLFLVQLPGIDRMEWHLVRASQIHLPFVHQFCRAAKMINKYKNY
jgi:hypothetical protein